LWHAPNEGVVLALLYPGGTGRCCQQHVGSRHLTKSQLGERHIGAIPSEAAQDAAQGTAIFGLTEHQDHGVEVAGEKADAHHWTSSTSVA
jgi:hypothetical protein